MRIPLNLAPGLVGDETDFSTGGWKSGTGVRFWRGRPESVLGFESLSLTALTGVCRTTFGWTDADSLQTFAFGLHNGLTVWQAGEQVDITPSAFVDGQIDGTGGAGYGTGAFGVGDYGEPSLTAYFPLTWSFGSRFGELFANPRGQGIAVPLTNAPAACNFILTTWTAQIMALGCTDSGGLFNPSCIRISDVLDPEEWTDTAATTAQQYYLEGNGRIIGARQIGRYVFVWTDSELHLGSYSDSWSFERIGAGGLAGPNAAIVKGQTAYWIAPDLQFYGCQVGAAPALLLSNDGKPCPVRQDFADNAAIGQNDKIVAASVSERDEILWCYSDAREGYENSRIIRLSTLDGAWSLDEEARTSFVDANPAPSPVSTTYAGNIYWQERGSSRDGAPLSWSIETGDQYMDPGERFMMLREWRPDFADQIGPVSLWVTTKRTPQGTETVHGPYIASPGQSKVDLRCSGLTFRFQFVGNSSPSYARFGKQTFDVQAAGER